MSRIKPVVVYAPADAQHPNYRALQDEMRWKDIVFSGSPVAETYARWVCNCHLIAHEIEKGGVAWDGPDVDFGQGSFPTATYKGHSFRDYGRPVFLHRRGGELLAELGGSLPAPLERSTEYNHPRHLLNVEPYKVIIREGQYRFLTPVAYATVKVKH